MTRIFMCCITWGALVVIGIMLLTSCGGSAPSSSDSAAQRIIVRSAASKAIPTLAQQYDVLRLIQAMFNAASGRMYLNEFAGYVAGGMTMEQLANLLEQTDAFKNPQLYPTSLDDHSFAEKFIDNLVGSTVNRVDKDWAVSAIIARLNDGKTRGEAIWWAASTLATVSGVDPNWGRAATQFTNRTEVSYDYSVIKAQSSEDLGTLQAVIAGVTDDPATMTTAKNTTPVNLAPSWASLNITSENRKIDVGWADLSKTTGTVTYNLYWSNTPGVTKKTGKKIANATNPYTHTGLINGAMYYYVVTTMASGFEGPESLEVGTAPKGAVPPTPIGVAVAPSNGAVQLSLDSSNTATASKFNLYYATNPALTNATKIPNAFGSGTTYRHAQLVNGTTYYYAVTAEGTDGESSKSQIVAATPLADISAFNYVASKSQATIAAPNAITATSGNQSVTLSWNMPTYQIPTIFNPDATPTQSPVISSYNIYWSTSLITNPATTNKISLSAASTTLPVAFIHNTGLHNGISYYYIITAVAEQDTNGDPLSTVDGKTLVFESPLGSQIKVVPEATAPVAPTALSAVSGAQQISLSWTLSSTNSAIYNIYMSTIKPTKPEDLISPVNLIAKTNQVPYVHSGLQNGLTYYYTVTSVTDGESAPTALVSIELF